MVALQSLDPDLADLASWDSTRGFYTPLGRRPVPTRLQLTGFCVEVRTNDPAGFRRDDLEDRVRTIVERHGFDPDGPREIVDGGDFGNGGYTRRYYYLNRLDWTP